MTSLSFTPAFGSPAAGRIAEIRSKLGSHVPASGAFSLRLDAAIAAESAPAAVSVDEAVQGTSGSSLALAAISAGAALAAPAVVAPVDGNHSMVSDDTPYAALFNEAGLRHGVNPVLLASVAQVESGFDPTALSSAGAGGLMQFMPATADEMGVDRFDPASAIDGAARYLARDLDRFGELDLAIAAYNAGPAAVARHDGIPPIPETEQYVEKVLTAMEAHR